MPHYDYQCEKCGKVFEEFHKMSEQPELKCPSCGGKPKRMIGGGAGIVFKGSGFYKTDYKNSGGCANKNDSNPACSSCASGTSHKH